MIFTVLFALSVASAPSQTGLATRAQPPAAESTLVVRNATSKVRVPLTQSADGPMVSLESLAPVVPATVKRVAPGEFEAVVFGVRMRFEPGSAVVKVGDDTHQLAAAPVERRGRLLVPLQFVSEVLPVIAPNLRWDVNAHQLVAFSMPAAAESTAVKARAVATKSARTVVVDAGHGGPDNGMSGPIFGGPHIFEKNITLAVAKRVGEELKSRGVNVVYTRTTDTLIALSDRGKIANQADGDLFISIHVNAANLHWKDPAAARGFETYFLSEAKTEDARRVEQMENEAVRYESGPNVSRDDPLNFIVSDMMQNEHLRESSELAATIQRSLGSAEPGPSRGVKQAGFRVLVTAYMPAVLVEIGFGTNAAEAAYMSSPEKQQQIANAIADGAIAYLQRYERRVSGSGQ